MCASASVLGRAFQFLIRLWSGPALYGPSSVNAEPGSTRPANFGLALKLNKLTEELKN